MATQGFELTPEQIAKREARKAKKLLEAQLQATATPVLDAKAVIKERPWINTVSEPVEGTKLKIMTWNLLAQCLVRRESFPTSDCLRGKEREGMTLTEMFSHNADIMCFQEVDRLEKILPTLEKASFEHQYASGPSKKHGCLIAFRKDKYTCVGERLVHYDKEEVRSSGKDNTRVGSSFRTKNIGSIVALQDAHDDEKGVIVATTHLFWHPRYVYERARQTGLLKRAVLKFRSERGCDHWPCVIAGDFNFQPNDPGYALAIGDTLYAGHEELIQASHVVHANIDPSNAAPGALVEEDEDADPDKVITNARRAVEADGLLSAAELESLFVSSGPPLRSAYDEGLRRNESKTSIPPPFGERMQLPPDRLGAFEPAYTNFTYYWKLTLDYIFVIDPKDAPRRSLITGLLAPHRKEDMEPGLPRLGICASDHTALCAEITFL